MSNKLTSSKSLCVLPRVFRQSVIRKGEQAGQKAKAADRPSDKAGLAASAVRLRDAPAPNRGPKTLEPEIL